MKDQREALLPVLADLRQLFQHLYRQHDDVVKINGIVGPQQMLIAGINRSRNLLKWVG